MSAIPGDSFSSILSRFAKSASPSDPTQSNLLDNDANEPKPLPLTTTKPCSSVRVYPAGTAPVPATISRHSSVVELSENPIASKPAGRKLHSFMKTQDAPLKRPKLDQPMKSIELLSEKQKEMAERKKKLMAIKMMKDKAAAQVNMDGRKIDNVKLPAPSQATRGEVKASKTSQSDAIPKKGESYRETLARAAQQYESRKAVAGAITHKARTPVEHKKEWQKRLADKQKQKDEGNPYERASKSPGIHSGAEKSILSGRKVNDLGKLGSQRKLTANIDPRRMSTLSKGIPNDKKTSSDFMGKRKRASHSPAPRVIPKKTVITGYRGVSKKFQNPARRKKYEDEEDNYDDDWIVEDEEDDEPRAGGGYGYSKRYRYADSDYDSESDMEAGGVDVLEEEERSRRVAIKEDQEQEKLEAELAARKVAMKKKK